MYAGPPYLGGVETTIAAQARFLAGRGYPVRILAGNGADLGDGIQTEIVPEFGSRGEVVDAVNREVNRGTVSAQFDALVDRIVDRLIDALTGVSALIVHNVLTMHKNLALTTALARLHEAARLPHVLAWCHDFAWIDPIYNADLHEGDPWDLLRKPWSGVRYVVVSAERQTSLASLLGRTPRHIEVVPPGSISRSS